MRITTNHGTALNPAFFARRSVYQEPETERPTGTSLVVHPLAALSSNASATGRPDASLLAQLIAKTLDLPVSRVRCRIDPLQGANAYRAIAGLGRANENGKLRLI
jgi:hypothetical protein